MSNVSEPVRNREVSVGSGAGNQLGRTMVSRTSLGATFHFKLISSSYHSESFIYSLLCDWFLGQERTGTVDADCCDLSILVLAPPVGAENKTSLSV